MKILITGGAGFVGSRLALSYKEHVPGAQITVFDNLKRRGAELNLPIFRERDIRFVHGDIREAHDFDALNSTFDLFIEASAEPSVHAGLQGSPDYVVDTNLRGTWHCLEFARKAAPRLIFLSTSRVYAMEPLKAIRLHETDQRFEIDSHQTLDGVSEQGINESFPVMGARSLYGATKLASELLIQEYVYSYGLKAIMNRCGVLAGPGQFGKSDQGVFTLWLANHLFGRPLRYTGFGGQGKQVRDLLHPSDLFALLVAQEKQLEAKSGATYNVGGGRAVSTSLKELTALCQQLSGRTVPIASDPATAAVDIPLYISDARRAMRDFHWHPERQVEAIMRETLEWLKQNEKSLMSIL